MNKKWEICEKNEDLVKEISKKHNISELLANILVNRNIVNDDEIKVFLNPTRNDFHDPYLMPDMDKAVERIIKAIENQEKTIIYGDYDVDGITSICVLSQKGPEFKKQVDYDLAEVYFKKMTRQEIEAWIDFDKPYDKSGSYAVQSRFGVHIEKINGNFFTVMGLPIHKLYDMLKQISQLGT